MRQGLSLSPRAATQTRLQTSLTWETAGTAVLCAVFAFTFFYHNQPLKGVLPGYAWRKQLEVHPDQVHGADPLPDYAMLVSLADPDLRSVNQGGKVFSATGQDLRFTQKDGSTLLPHQIESYNATTGDLRAWVKLDTLWTQQKTTAYLYFGNKETALSPTPETTYSEIPLSALEAGTPTGNREITLANNVRAPENFYVVSDTKALDPTYPVKLSSYQVRRKEDIGVIVEWTSEQERNNKVFLVERSVDGRQFSILGELGGAGNSDVSLSYTFLDTDPVEGKAYYRLRQTGEAHTYTDVALAEVYFTLEDPGLQIISVLPNPFADQFMIRYSNTSSSPVKLDIYNAEGDVLLSKQLTSSAGENEYQFVPTSELLPGIYVVSMLGKDGKLRTQILKKEIPQPPVTEDTSSSEVRQ